MATSAFDLSSLILGLNQSQPQHYSSDPQLHRSASSAQHPIPRTVRTGVTKFFSSSKGFGFINDNHAEELGGQEVFCHFSAISGKGGFRSLAEGEEVEYELVQGPKGYQAANLTGPNGRNVVGDPKARLAKPPPYMPFAPMSMPPYLADPYQQQLSGAYAASPYTQHVMYTPSTMHSSPVPVPASSFGYSGSSLLSSPQSSLASNSFRPAQYQQQQQQQQQQAYGAYQSMSQPAVNLGGYRGGVIGGRSGSGAIPTAFSQLSPPGGHYQQLPQANGSGGRREDNFGFSGPSYTPPPFNSPPSFGNPPLFGQNTNGQASQPQPPSSTQPISIPSNGSAFGLTSQHQPHRSTSSSRDASTGLGLGSGSAGSGSSGAGSSALFGSGPPNVGVVGTPRSSSGTPSERRGTPLGNGTIGGGGAGGSSSVFAPIHYASTDRQFA